MATTPRIITRTIIGSRTLAALQQGKPYTPVPFSTLNEALGIHANVMPTEGDTPRVRYYAIGMKGHVNRQGADGGHYTQAVQHSPDDFGLYAQLPFLLRSPNDDLTPSERTNYALRKIITVNGENFIAYYLKRIPIDNEPVKMLHHTVIDGQTVSVPFVPDNSNLHPQPRDPAAVGAITTNGTYLTTSSLMAIHFDSYDVTNLIEVAKIMFGNPERALISELALVAGSDRTLSVTDPGQSAFNMVECVQAHITTHITGLWPVAFQADGFKYQLDLGANEPLYGVATGGATTP